MKKFIYILLFIFLSGCSVVKVVNETPQVKAYIRDKNDNPIKNKAVTLCFKRDDEQCQNEVKTKTDNHGEIFVYNNKYLTISFASSYHLDITLDNNGSLYQFSEDKEGDMPPGILIWCYLKDNNFYCG